MTAHPPRPAPPAVRPAPPAVRQAEPEGVAGPTGRVAVIGDVGGHADELRRALIDLGLDERTGQLPDDLIVIQVGDLIHRGPDSPGAIALVDRIQLGQPDRWIQLAGNHEAQYLAPPMFHWPERLDEEDIETIYGWWHSGRMGVAAAVAAPDGDWLVTHAGLTEGFWRHLLGLPEDATTAATALNRLVRGLRHTTLFRPGVMLTGDVDLSAGPFWASAPDELLPSWAASSAAAPFHQVHGHSSTVDFTTGRQYRSGLRDQPGIVTAEDPVLRHVTTEINGRRIIGVDPGHGRRPAPGWAPLVLEDARITARPRRPRSGVPRR